MLQAVEDIHAQCLTPSSLLVMTHPATDPVSPLAGMVIGSTTQMFMMVVSCVLGDGSCSQLVSSASADSTARWKVGYA
jgi:hypothetical protein